MSGRRIIDGLAFSIEGLKRDADEIEACGAGNEAAQMRWAAAALAEAQAEIARLRGALKEIAREPMNGELMEPIIKRNLHAARAALEAKTPGTPSDIPAPSHHPAGPCP